MMHTTDYNKYSIYTSIYATIKLLLPDLFNRFVFDEEDNWIDVCTM